MKIDQIKIEERPLIDSYRHNFKKVKEFFQYNPHEAASFKKRYNYLKTRDYPRRAVADALIRYNRRLGASKQTFQQIERLKEADTVAVITGQQAGVLTGPLYTIYKAITVLQLADSLNENRIPAIPIFWIASEDHDFQEIAGISHLNRDNQQREIKLEADVERQPIGRLQLKKEVLEFLERFAVETPDTDFKAVIIEKLTHLAENSDNLADWFGSIMAWLFKDTGLIFIDALDKELRSLGREFFIDIFEKNDLITECLTDSANRLKANSFSAQIKKNDQQVHLCLIADDQRYPLDKVANGYQLRGAGRLLSKKDIKSWITDLPEAVSTNVVTRPLFQDFLLPTIAYVGGPGETAYYAQYKDVYQIFEMEMPIIYPRASITLIERSIERCMEKYQLKATDIFQRFSQIRNNFLLESDQLNLKEKFGKLKGAFIPEYQKLLADLQHLDSKFKKLGNQNLKRIIEEINYLEEKADHQHRKNSEVLLRQLDKVKVNLYPKDIMQERYFNIFQYLFKYRLTLIEKLLKLDLLTPYYHHLIYL